MNLTLPDVSAEELSALRAQVQSLRNEADRQAREIRELESAVKVERPARERAEAKLKDLLRRLYGPMCFMKQIGANVRSATKCSSKNRRTQGPRGVL